MNWKELDWNDYNLKRIDWRELDGKFSIWKNKIVLEKGQGLERNEMERNGSYRIIALKRLDWKEFDKQGLYIFIHISKLVTYIKSFKQHLQNRSAHWASFKAISDASFLCVFWNLFRFYQWNHKFHKHSLSFLFQIFFF